MRDTKKIAHLPRCLSLIEEKLGWGRSEAWSNYDYEKLREAIFNDTKVHLSTTTLKRIWGRIAYRNAPTTSTLNALARFGGYEDWRSFIQNGAEPGGTITERAVIPDIRRDTGPERRGKIPWIPLAVIVVAMGLFFFGITRIKQVGIARNSSGPSGFSFSADKVIGEGVPNSVVFTYDASQAQTDSVFIIQTWDVRRKTLVPKEASHHSAIYYYPGFFRTRLVVDGEVVKSHDLQITSDGWLGLVELDDRPYYFRKEEIMKPDRVEVDEALLRANNFVLSPIAPRVLFFNQGDMGHLKNDNFEFQTTVRNDFISGNNRCQYVEVLIQCKDDVIIIPLMAPACTGDAYLYLPGRQFTSKYEDLTGFGADLGQWTTLKVTCKNRAMELYVNGRKAFAHTFSNDPTGIVGVQYRFPGMGAVKDTWFRGPEGLINL